MPRILRIINRFNLGGITYNVSYLSKYMPREYETLLIGGPEEDGEESSLFIPESLGLQPTIINEMRRSINPLADYFAYRRIKKIIKEFSPDIVHTHASKAGAIGRLAAISCKIPVIVHTFHGHVFEGYFNQFKTNVFKKIERYLSRRSSGIVAISEIQKNDLTSRFQVCSADRTVVIPLGFDLQRFTENKEEKRKSFRLQFGIHDDELALGIVGRLAPIKNHFLFIDAIEYVSKKTKRKIKAVIIGDGETKLQLINYIKEKGLSYSESNEQALFVFTSWIKNVDVALAGLDIVCLTSKNEGTPVSLIEAQSAGKFIVTTNVGGIKDILHPDCGLLSPANELIQYQNNLLEAVDNFEKVNAQAGVASEIIIEKYSYKRLCSDMDQLYQTLLARVKK